MRTFGYVRPADADDASARLRNGARAMGGGTDVLTQLDRDILPADEVVDLRALGLSASRATARRCGSARRRGRRRRARLRHRRALHRARPGGRRRRLAPARDGDGRGTPAGAVRYFRTDLQCWLRGGDTCYRSAFHRSTASSPATASQSPSIWPRRCRRAPRSGRPPGGCRSPSLPACDRRRALDATHARAGEFLTAVEVPGAGRERYVTPATGGGARARGRAAQGSSDVGWPRSACRTSPGRSIPATRRRGSQAWT